MEFEDSVGIRKGEGLEFVGTGKIMEVTTRMYKVKAANNRRYLSGSYLRSSLIGPSQSKGTFSIIHLTAEHAIKIEKEIEDRENAEREARYEAEVRKRKAEYDALPEEIKLARKLRWFCEMNGEKTIAGAPIDAIRTIIDWAIANKKEVE